MRIPLLLSLLLSASAVAAQPLAADGNPQDAPPLTTVEDAPAAPSAGPPDAAERAPPSTNDDAGTDAAEASTSETAPRPRDRTFVKTAGASAAALGGGMLVGGIVGGIGGVVAGAALGLLLGPFYVIASPFFALLLGTVGLLAGGLIGGGVAFLGSLFFIPPAGPPDYELPRNVITVAPGELVLGRFGFEYERQLTPHLTAFVAPLFEHGTPGLWLWRGGAGPSVTAGMRAYLWGQAPRGAFVGLQLHGGLGQFTHPAAGLTAATQDTFGGAGVSFGHSWLFARHFAVGYGLGVTYQVTHAVTPGSGARQIIHEVTPTLRLTLGGAL